MKTILTINAGSSSLKFSVWRQQRRLDRGQIEQIGGRARLTVGHRTTLVNVPTLAAAMAVLKTRLTHRGVVPDIVAHRIVHGGEWYFRPTHLNPTAMKRLRSIIHLAPLHLPANLEAVGLVQRFWPSGRSYGVFDTALYHDLPEAARRYALPAVITKRFRIRKYGFHGTSHEWVLEQAARKLMVPPRQMNAVTVHLGAGASLTRWHGGRAVDTSMGFTPLAGVVMATRTGDLDPMIPLYLQERGSWSAARVATMLNKQSGLLGITGLGDMRDILQAAGHPVIGWPRRRWSAVQRRTAKLGLGMYIYSIQRYISMYAGLAPAADVMVFTGAVGCNRTVQQMILRGLSPRRGRRVLTIIADEEQAIAEAVRRVIQ